MGIAAPVQALPTFVPLQVEAPAAVPPIHIELQRGATSVKIIWPPEMAAQCAAWLRELFR
jgi:transposase